MRRAFKRLELHTEMYMSKVGRQVSYHITEEDAEKVREFFNPVGWVALVDISREIGRSTQTLKIYLRNQGILIRQMLNEFDGKVRPVEHIQEEFAVEVIEYYATEEASDEWVSLSLLAPELGVTLSALSAMTKKRRAESRHFASHNNSRTTPFVKKEFAETLRSYYQNKKAS